MKLCPVWAAYTHKQHVEYYRQLAKVRITAYRVWLKARTEANNLKVLNAVPTRPNNPDVPAAYNGPIT
jgi:hypothetical protein